MTLTQKTQATAKPNNWLMEIIKKVNSNAVESNKSQPEQETTASASSAKEPEPSAAKPDAQ